METKIRSIDSIMQGAQPCTLFEDVLTELREKRNRLGYDPDQLKIDRDWSALTTKSVGY